MKQKIMVLMLASLIISCGSFNEGQAELHINKNISTGQELLDLKAALDEGIITKEEFDKLREDIINGNQEFEIDIEEFENLDGDKSENVKIRININGNDIVNIDSEDE
ncbi:SHOCT domain-containing protein [Candidatus Marinimicrobia bacterium]|nr:SHOCT domain-containing protein [Candidatus Neomarinimicrobiota bacterium]MDA9735459.1 SHOCT domain-containing protein [Candidatus Neomarinimicrobiota bacterium]